MNYIKDIQLQPTKDTYNVIIEIPKHTNKKFELNDPLFTDAVCTRRVHGKYPFYYGCFPETHAGDGDPLDMILLSNKKHHKLDIVEVYVIGVIKTIDAGFIDDKILVIPTNEPVKNILKLEKKAIKFLKHYKGKHSKMILDETIYDIDEALPIIERAHTNYENQDSNTLSSF